MFGFINRLIGRNAVEAKSANLPTHSDILSALLRPSYIENNFDSMRINSYYNRIIMAVG